MPKHKREWIFGHHAVEAALKAEKREFFELMILDQHRNTYAWVRQELPFIKVTIADRLTFDRMAPKDQPHQGVALYAGLLPALTAKELPEDAKLLLALDQITDPHNIGACLRSADAFGVSAVLVPGQRSGHNSAVVAKAAAGALETVPVIEVGNLVHAIENLKEDGYWVVGLAGEGDKDLSELDLTGKIIVVMGSEGEGLRDLVAQKCDFLARIPMVGTVESLNVSVACGITLYEILRQNKQGSKKK